MDILIFVGGIVIGAIVAWLFAKAQHQAGRGFSMIEVESKYVPKELYSDAKRELYEHHQKILQLSKQVAAQDQQIAAYQENNVIKIAQESGKLYDKFANFVEDLQSIGRQLEAVRKSYDGAMNKLVDGRGSLVKKSERPAVAVPTQ